MDGIYSLLKVLVICIAFIGLFSFIGEIVSEWQLKSRILNLIKSLLAYMLQCPKCSSFWSALIMTGDLFQASVISIIINIGSSINIKKKTTL